LELDGEDAHDVDALFCSILTCIGESTVTDHDSRESTIDVIGDAAGGDDHDDSDGNLDLLTLEDLLSEAKARRHVAVSEPGQELQKPTDPERLVHNGSA